LDAAAEEVLLGAFFGEGSGARGAGGEEGGAGS